MGGSGCDHHPIRGRFSSKYCIKNYGCGNHPGPSKDERTDDIINNDLDLMREKMKESVSLIEEDIIKEIECGMNSVIKRIKQANNEEYGGKKLNVNIDEIEQKKKNLSNKVKNYISNEINKKLVLGNVELKVLLQEDDDEKRNKEFDEYVNKMQIDAIKGLKIMIKKTIENQSKILTSEISGRIGEVEESLRHTQSVYKEFQEKDDDEKNELLIEQMFVHDLYALLLDIAEE